MFIKFFCMFLFLSLPLGYSTPSALFSAQDSPGIAREVIPYSTPLPFRFLVTENSLRSPKVRHVEIFMDVKAFSKENLEQLFRYVADGNPNPSRLSIQVYTDWEQVIPLGATSGGQSRMPTNASEYAHRQANYLRQETPIGLKAYFDYYPDPGKPDYLTVEMRRR